MELGQMIAPIMLASVITGLIVGSWLTLMVATAAMHRSQERMQRKVRYWQAEAKRAEKLTRQRIDTAVDELTGQEP